MAIAPKDKRSMAGVPLLYLKEHMYDGCCTEWPFTKQGGYGWVWNHGKRIGAAHVIVCEIVNGKRPSKNHHARHLCGKGHLGCFNADCMQWGTAKENYNDAIEHGTSTKGEKVGTCKLKQEDIEKIRSMRGKFKQREIADMFGVSQSLISLIQLNKWWKHV